MLKLIFVLVITLLGVVFYKNLRNDARRIKDLDKAREEFLDAEHKLTISKVKSKIRETEKQAKTKI